MQYFIYLLFFQFLLMFNIYGQNDTIKGVVYSSKNFERPKGEIFINKQGDKKVVKADALGYFELIVKHHKEDYLIEIKSENHERLVYNYKASWCKRIHPKSIVIKSLDTIHDPDLDENKSLLLSKLKNEIAKEALLVKANKIKNNPCFF